MTRAPEPRFSAPLTWKAARTGVRQLHGRTSSTPAADPWRDAAWAIVRRTPHLTYQILTKRANRIAGHLPADWGAAGYPNVWLGVSVEHQATAYRIGQLLAAPAAVRFVSYEPALGPLDLAPYLDERSIAAPLPADRCRPPARRRGYGGADLERSLHWVIVGGESGGREARPYRPRLGAGRPGAVPGSGRGVLRETAGERLGAGGARRGLARRRLERLARGPAGARVPRRDVRCAAGAAQAHAGGAPVSGVVVTVTCPTHHLGAWLAGGALPGEPEDGTEHHLRRAAGMREVAG